MAIAIDLTGQRFGRLLAERRDHTSAGEVRWLCRCECGKSKAVRSSLLRGGITQSCGCLHRELLAAKNAQRARHGHTTYASGTYGSWSAMKTRCLNPNDSDWQRYGARGITICDRWLTFENFLADMGERPEGKTLDRYPNQAGNYEPGNCRWATPREQGRNRRSNRPIEFEGRTLCLAEWAERFGMDPDLFSQRLSRMPFSEAMKQPPRRRSRQAE
jgi:hypothetical protein